MYRSGDCPAMLRASPTFCDRAVQKGRGATGGAIRTAVQQLACNGGGILAALYPYARCRRDASAGTYTRLLRHSSSLHVAYLIKYGRSMDQGIECACWIITLRALAREQRGGVAHRQHAVSGPSPCQRHSLSVFVYTSTADKRLGVKAGLLQGLRHPHIQDAVPGDLGARATVEEPHLLVK